MWDMIERMAGDRLWIYTGIAGSLFGAAFLAWFQGTRKPGCGAMPSLF